MPPTQAESLTQKRQTESTHYRRFDLGFDFLLGRRFLFGVGGGGRGGGGRGRGGAAISGAGGGEADVRRGDFEPLVVFVVGIQIELDHDFAGVGSA